MYMILWWHDPQKYWVVYENIWKSLGLFIPLLPKGSPSVWFKERKGKKTDLTNLSRWLEHKHAETTGSDCWSKPGRSLISTWACGGSLTKTFAEDLISCFESQWQSVIENKFRQFDEDPQVFYHDQVTKKQDVTNVTNVYQKKTLKPDVYQSMWDLNNGREKRSKWVDNNIDDDWSWFDQQEWQELQNNQESVSQPEGLDPTSIAFLVLK